MCLGAVGRDKSQHKKNAMAGQCQRYRWQAAVLVRCMHAGPVDNSIDVERLNGLHSPALWTEAECSVTTAQEQ
jgi:hypothetical protein